MIRRDGPIVSALHRRAALVTAAALHVALVTGAHAARVERINLAVDGALRTLYGHAAGARALRDKARAVLVFPRIVKTGSASGERGGAGVLREHGVSTGYYRSLGVFHGVEPGIESFGYALFFMSKPALDVLRRSDGWEIGTGQSVVVVDEGTTRQLSTAGPQVALGSERRDLRSPKLDADHQTLLRAIYSPSSSLRLLGSSAVHGHAGDPHRRGRCTRPALGL